MRLIIAGGREFNSYTLLKSEVLAWVDSLGLDLCNIEIVSGMARGADSLGLQFAEEFQRKVKCFPANWEKFGKRAGYIRNAEMAAYGDALIAFWDGKSKGTLHMITEAERRNLLTQVIEY